MKTVKLGNTDIEISPVGLGCMGFTHAYGKPIEKQEAVKIIRKAYDLGYTFLIQLKDILEYILMAQLLIMKKLLAKL